MKISPELESRIEALPQGIFFTLVVLFFVGLALFFALLFGQFELTLFSLILLFLGLGLRTWSRWSMRDLSVLLSVDNPKVFPGEKIDFRLTVTNEKLLPVFVQIRLILPQYLAGGNEDLLIKKQCGVLWHQTIRFHKTLNPIRRGTYNSGAPRLMTGDFFGFFPKPARDQQPVDILVFPRLTGVRLFPILNRTLFGKKADKSPVHDPIHILGTRDYRSFSSSRNIHWKATARHHKLQEKIFEVSEQEKLYMILEGNGFLESNDEAAFEKAIEAIASLSLLWAVRHYAVGFLTDCAMHQHGPNFLPPERRPKHLPKLFEMLARIDFRLAAPLSTFINTSRQHYNGAPCLFFSYDPIPAKYAPVQSSLLINIVCRLRSGDTHREKGGTPTVYTLFLEDICEEG